jgi:predicted RND superfamily exporter protein
MAKPGGGVVVAVLEKFVFRHRIAVLVVLGAVTLAMGYFASQLRMDAGFAKQLPREHEYVKTFFEYQDRLFGSNRVIVVVRAKHGDIWNQPFLAKLQEVTDALFFLPGVDRRTVTSIWTPNTRYFEITEEGLIADDVIPSHVLPASMGPEEVALVRDNVIKGGYVGRLVAKDYTAAMITAELLETDPRTEVRLDYLDLAARLESEIREKSETEDFDIHILGFVALMGQIAAGAAGVVRFFALAFALTAAAVYLYSRSWIMTFLPLVCSLTSVVWQFAVVHLLGFGLDPLAILVPFLVFAIGVSHGVQQINLISKQICGGADSMTAARRGFSGLLVSGSGALITDMIGFGTLVIMPIAMIQELGITALIGVAFQIVTILVMLPVLASFFRFDEGYVERMTRSRESRERLIRGLGRIAEPRYAVRAIVVFAVVYGLAVWQSQGRHVGDLQPGAPELRPDSRYNRDAMTIASKFSLGLDVLTVIVETPAESCIDYEVMQYLNEFDWHMRNVPGVLSVASVPAVAKLTNAGGSEGNLKWNALPRNRYLLVRAAGRIPEETGLLNAECTLMPLYVFTADHKAETIKRAIAAVEEFRDTRPMEGVRIRLASGNVGVQAAVNEELESSETPMMVYVYLAIILLVFVIYRDWRATICCCVPLTMATFLGYWFMKELEIGLKVATMPVMVLAVGLGVDYAFYIYNRLQIHLSGGLDMTTAYKQTLFETGNAVIFTAITLAIGVATWSFSALKFQADMGLLLTFMFTINMVMAVTMLPALAVVIDLLIPRRKRVKVPGLGA